LVDRIHDAHTDLVNLLDDPAARLSSLKWIVFWVVTIPLLLRVAFRSLPTFESPLVDVLFYSALGAAFLAIVFQAFYFVSLWQGLNKLLRRIVRLPMVRAYERLPDEIRLLLGRYLNSTRPAVALLWNPVQQVGPLGKHLKAVEGRPTELLRELLSSRNDEGIQKTFQRNLKEEDKLTTAGGDVQSKLDQASKYIVQILAPYWGERSIQDILEDPAPDEGASDKQKRKEIWIENAETFVAMRLVAYLSQFFLQLTYQIEFLVAGSFLFFLAIVSYSFQPQRLLTIVGTVLIAGVALLVLLFFIRMDRSELISRIGKSKLDRLSVDLTFFRNIIPYLAPLVTLLVAQVPEMRDLLASWFEPLFRVMR
jgi:hypothetical protein